VITTIVSSSLLARMADAAGVQCEETFTGFKWIGKVVTERPDRRFVFGYEQALGYLVTNRPLDKDGISAAVMMAEITGLALADGVTLEDRLDAIADRFGRYVTAELSAKMPPPRPEAALPFNAELLARNDASPDNLMPPPSPTTLPPAIRTLFKTRLALDSIRRKSVVACALRAIVTCNCCRVPPPLIVTGLLSTSALDVPCVGFAKLIAKPLLKPIESLLPKASPLLVQWREAEPRLIELTASSRLQTPCAFAGEPVLTVSVAADAIPDALSAIAAASGARLKLPVRRTNLLFMG